VSDLDFEALKTLAAEREERNTVGRKNVSSMSIKWGNNEEEVRVVGLDPKHPNTSVRFPT
jgi:hypothetical protein